jgi:hypothetical protein
VEGSGEEMHRAEELLQMVSGEQKFGL